MNQASPLPNNISELHQMVLTLQVMLTQQQEALMERESIIAQQHSQVTELNHTILSLTDSLKIARLGLFGRSSEKWNNIQHTQGFLFDEAELNECSYNLAELGIHFDDVTDNATQDDIIGSNIIGGNSNGTDHSSTGHCANNKRRGYRKSLPNYLEHIRVEHTLPESALSLENGLPFTKFGEDISEQIDVIPAKVVVIQNVRFKYCVKGHEAYGVKVAPLSTQPIPKGIASAGFLARIVESKFDYHLPLYRQERLWQAGGIDITPGTMSRNLVQLGELVQPLINLMIKSQKTYGVTQADETPLTVIYDQRNINPETNQNKKPSHRCYMFVYRNPRYTTYQYHSSRSDQHAVEYLKDYRGVVQTDGYSGYHQIFDTRPQATLNNQMDLHSKIHAACMAHARHKFTDIVKAASKSNQPMYSQKALKLIQSLYKIEKVIREEKQLNTGNSYHTSVIEALRQKKAKPILDQLFTLLKAIQSKVPEKSLLGKAIYYTLNLKAELSVYINHGKVEIDNNGAERAVKPFVIGRKNWLVSGHTQSAKASANLFTLVENAKQYNLKVQPYLKRLFEQIRLAKTDELLEALLPENLRQESNHESSQFVF